MGLFRRHKDEAAPAAGDGAPGLAQAAAGRGFAPAGDDPFPGDQRDRIKRMSRVLHGFPPRPLSTGGGYQIPDMHVSDAHTGSLDGRTVTVARANTPTEGLDVMTHHGHATSVVAVEMGTMMLLGGIEPRAKHHAISLPEIATGNPAFDQRYRVSATSGDVAALVTPEVQSRVMARDDWAFVPCESTLLCVVKGESPDLFALADEVLAILHAFPASVVPDAIDHSFDDLLRRIDALDSVEEATDFLQQLSDEDRGRLAASPTPLAKFADVRTADEIGVRFMSLSEAERLQVLAMFDKATGQ